MSDCRTLLLVVAVGVVDRMTFSAGCSLVHRAPTVTQVRRSISVVDCPAVAVVVVVVVTAVADLGVMSVKRSLL